MMTVAETRPCGLCDDLVDAAAVGVAIFWGYPGPLERPPTATYQWVLMEPIGSLQDADQWIHWSCWAAHHEKAWGD